MSADWHVDPDLLGDYAGGRALAPSLVASVEAHLEGCAHCQRALVPVAPADRLDAVWAAVVHELDAPPVPAVERLLARLGASPETARLLAVTPSLRLSWLTGTVLVLLMALGVAHSGARGVAVFLALAPLLPVAGVAMAFGRRVDPLHEIAVAAPYSSWRLLLLRSAVVVASTVLLAVPAAALLPGSPWLAVGWLLPGLALTTTSLALSSRVDPVVSGAGLAAGWLVLSLSALRPGADPLLVVQAGPQLGCLVLVLVAGALLLRQQRRAPLLSGSLS